MWYQSVANKHMLHHKIGNNYNTTTNIFLPAYIKLCYDLCDLFLEFLYNNCLLFSHSHYRALIYQVLKI